MSPPRPLTQGPCGIPLLAKLGFRVEGLGFRLFLFLGSRVLRRWESKWSVGTRVEGSRCLNTGSSEKCATTIENVAAHGLLAVCNIGGLNNYQYHIGLYRVI